MYTQKMFTKHYSCVSIILDPCDYMGGDIDDNAKLMVVVLKVALYLNGCKPTVNLFLVRSKIN